MTTAYHHHHYHQHHHFYQRGNNDSNNNNASTTIDAFKLLQQKNNERNKTVVLQNLLFDTNSTTTTTADANKTKTKTTTTTKASKVIVRADDVELHCVRQTAASDIINIHNHNHHNQKDEEDSFSIHQHYRSSPVINKKNINYNTSCENNNSSIKRTLRHSLTRQSCFDSTLRHSGNNGLKRQGFSSFDSPTNFQDKSLNHFERRHSLLTSTPTRLRKSSILRDIIIESVSETQHTSTMGEVNENTTQQHNNNNNTNPYKNGIINASSETTNIESQNNHHSTTPTKTTTASGKKAGGYVRDPKKVYRHRKHHSDYGIVFLQVDDSFDHSDDNSRNETENMTTAPRSRTMSYSSDDHEDQILSGGLKVSDTSKLHSKSDSNLDESGAFNRPCRSPKSNSHLDITSTQMYKDIYADNLRQYGFLLAKVSIFFLNFSFNFSYKIKHLMELHKSSRSVV